MPLREQNYWLTTTEFPKPDAFCPVPEVVDVAVIGAGFTGLSAARTLAKRGARVAVLESETIGWGASSRNGGMVLTGMKLGVNQLIAMYGRELTQRMYAASLASMDCVEQIVREEMDAIGGQEFLLRPYIKAILDQVQPPAVKIWSTFG